MINIKPPRLSPVTNTSLFTLLLQPGFSCLRLPACLCKSSLSLSVPAYCCCRLSDLLSQLYFSLSFLSPFSLFPSLILSLPLSPAPTQEKNLEWFPRMRAMSLVSSEGDNEQNEMRSLQEKLDSTVTLVAQLSGQLAELKEQVECHFRRLSCCGGKSSGPSTLMIWTECLMNNLKQNPPVFF